MKKLILILIIFPQLVQAQERKQKIVLEEKIPLFGKVFSTLVYDDGKPELMVIDRKNVYKIV